MQIETAVRNVQNNTHGTVHKFNFELNEKTAQLLSDPYSNKPRAVLREPSCNAQDSHNMAGNPDPIQIWLPSRLDPVLIVKDNGVGLHPDEIGKLFCTYGGTNKDKLNSTASGLAITGGLGFGSKAPWAVTDQFTVEARWEGKMYCYSMLKDQDGIPAYTLVGVVDTLEPNGLTIKIPVKADLVDKFHTEARRLFRRFNPMPKVMNVPNFKIEPIKYAIKDHTWRIPVEGWDDTESQYPRAMAVQGNVAYPIDQSALGNLTDAQEAALECKVEVDFPMGEIQVPLSRESISYTPNTVANIKKRLQEIGEALPKRFEDQMAAAKTEYEARSIYRTISNDLGYHMRNLLASKLKWNAELISTNLKKIDNPDDTKISQIFISVGDQQSRRRLNLAQSSDELHFDCGREIIVWWDKKVKFIRSYIDEYWRGKDKCLNIICCESEDDFKTVLDEAGSPENWVNLNDFDKPETQSLSSGPSSPKHPVAKVFESTSGRHFRETTLPSDHGGICVPINRGNPEKFYHPGGEWADAEATYRALVHLRNDNFTLYGIPASHKNLSKKYPDKWLNLYEVAAKEGREFLEAQTDEDVADYFANYEFLDNDNLARFVRNTFLKNGFIDPNQFGVPKKSAFYQFCLNVNRFVEKEKWEAARSINMLLLRGDQIKPKNASVDLSKLAKDIRTDHLLVSYLFPSGGLYHGGVSVGDKGYQNLFTEIANYIAKV